MLKINYCLFVSILFTATILISQSRYIRLDSLPFEAHKVIEKKYGTWDFFNSSVPYFDSTSQMKVWKYTDLVKADFNNDTKTDYAVLVKPADTKKGFFLILLQNKNTYDCVEIEKIPYMKDMMLFLTPKNSKLFDYDDQSYFTLPNVGVTLAFYEKAGTTYFMKNGKFGGVCSAD